MARPFVYLICLVFTAIGINSCTSSKIISSGSNEVNPTYTDQEIIAAIGKNNLDFETFQVKAKTKLNSPQENVSGLAYIRAKKDSSIWMLFKKRSVEASRILISPDSFYVILRLEQQYRKGPVSEIENEFNIDFSFPDLQKLLTGNVILPHPEKTNIYKDDKSIKVVSNYQGYALTYALNPESLLLNQVTVNDGMEDLVIVEYSDYRAYNDSIAIAYSRSIITPLEEGGAAKLSFDIIDIEHNQPMSIRFSIPAHYEEVH